MAEYLQRQLAVLKELVGHQRRNLREKGDKRQIGEEDDRLLVVAPPDGRVLHLPEVGKTKQEVVVQLERRQTAAVIMGMDRGNRLGPEFVAGSPPGERKRFSCAKVGEHRTLI